MIKRKTYIDTAMRRSEATLVLKGGKVVDVFTGEIKEADVIPHFRKN